MPLLLGIAFAAGLITALSPCVLPVLPVLLAGGAAGGRRRPYAIVAGLVLSFTIFTVTATALLDALGLPQDLLRDVAVGLLVLAGLAIAIPQLGELLQRPFLALTRRRPGDLGGGLLLGLALGLVFVPCAGPVLAAITVLAASRDFGAETFALTGAYALGAALPMLAVAVAGRRVAGALGGRYVRPALGAIVVAAALAIGLDVTRPLQTFLPGYTEAVQDRVERSAGAQREIARLTGARTGESSSLDDFGPAPELAGLSDWINSRALTLAGLRGKVVVVDFWTYSCINCLRTLPYLKAWYAAYRKAGLVVLGVHSPEFSFEHVPANVRNAVRELGIRYPVALDNYFETWRAFANQYWPAKYFIDRRGHIRFIHFGEGDYGESEHVIRTLLAEGGEAPPMLANAPTAEEPQAAITPETYLGWQRLDRYVGSKIQPGRWARYRFPSEPLGISELAYDGRWRVEGERIRSSAGSRLRLRFLARDVYLVLAGRGDVEALLNGKRVRTVHVTEPRLYTLLRLPDVRVGLLELRFGPGLAAHAFTFGAGRS
ncbi:MAG TPA: cytochrome c biogenesis protein DipZ [Gaiellaceae bacterium]|nr:cytochrome c biogenesis protein DipZ [Gaiellaceae bacterium]